MTRERFAIRKAGAVQAALPHWRFEELLVDMRVEEIILKCAGFIGHPLEHGGFAVVGTGFYVTVFEDAFEFAYFVTAAHVMWPGRKRERLPPITSVHIRINRINGGSRLESTTVPEWVFHQDNQIDVCALPLGIYPNREPEGSLDADDIVMLNLDTIALPRIAKYFPAASPKLGDEVFVTGAFVGRVGERKNIPVVRVGNIAALPQEPMDFSSPRRPAYLLETRSLGGISGSPVFWMDHTAGTTSTAVSTRSEDNGKIIVPYLLLGMMLGAHSGQYAEDFVSEQDTDIHPPKEVDFNAGIGVAMAIEDIIEFLEKDPMLKKKREAAVETKRGKSGYRPTSAAARVRLATDENPTHREDFTRLLNAAVRKPGSKD